MRNHLRHEGHGNGSETIARKDVVKGGRSYVWISVSSRVERSGTARV